jgi:hypothetical protein
MMCLGIASVSAGTLVSFPNLLDIRFRRTFSATLRALMPRARFLPLSFCTVATVSHRHPRQFPTT